MLRRVPHVVVPRRGLARGRLAVDREADPRVTPLEPREEPRQIGLLGRRQRVDFARRVRSDRLLPRGHHLAPGAARVALRDHDLVRGALFVAVVRAHEGVEFPGRRVVPEVLRDRRDRLVGGLGAAKHRRLRLRHQLGRRLDLAGSGAVEDAGRRRLEGQGDALLAGLHGVDQRRDPRRVEAEPLQPIELRHRGRLGQALDESELIGVCVRDLGGESRVPGGVQELGGEGEMR